MREICFSFSTGSSVAEQVSGLKAQLTKMKINPKTFFENKEIKEFFEAISNELAQAHLSEKTLNPDFINQYILAKSLSHMNLNTEQFNWLVGFNTSEKYQALLNSLQIENSSDFSNVNSPRASAVVVYDSVVANKQFLSTKYKSEGVFSTWKNSQLTPLQDSQKGRQ